MWRDFIASVQSAAKNLSTTPENVPVSVHFLYHPSSLMIRSLKINIYLFYNFFKNEDLGYKS